MVRYSSALAWFPFVCCLTSRFKLFVSSLPENVLVLFGGRLIDEFIKVMFLLSFALLDSDASTSRRPENNSRNTALTLPNCYISISTVGRRIRCAVDSYGI